LPNPVGTADDPGASALMPYSVSIPITRVFKRAAMSGPAAADSSRLPVEAMASA
jgi:hypothetical protein